MTLQLADARGQAERKEGELAHAKAQLESILNNISAGVLAFDENLRLISANRSADHVLRVDCAPLIARELGAWDALDPTLAPVSAAIREAFSTRRRDEWEQQVERDAKDGKQMLLLRGSRLPPGADTGYVVVFDDMTHLMQAQRDAAWAEVARRLAHEIKNPLTPIQLSAERVADKLAPKLAANDAEMLTRSTQTIINQVAALKNMVDAFRQYARMPEPAMRELDLNALVREVLTLYESLGSSIELELAADLPRIVGDSAHLRQVIHNLLQNAQDALAGSLHPQDRDLQRTRRQRGTLHDRGQWNRVSGKTHETRIRAVRDDEAESGTGLGLVIVKKIVEEHGGEVSIANVAPRGARVTITLPTAAARAPSKSSAPDSRSRLALICSRY